MAGGKETPKEEKQEPSVRRGSKSIWPWKKETDGSASFLRAARAGNLEKVLEFLKTNTDINTCNANGLNALHLASKEGHTNVVTALLDRSASVDSATKKGNTALHIASLAGQDEIVKVLVEHGATVNIQSQNGFTPLYMAAQENHDSVVRFLLSHGANQSLATEDGFTPLAVALQQGHDRVVSVLLENDTRGKVRLPALHIAAKKDDAKAAALLLHTDHNPDITSKSGFTPLHIASHYGNDNIAGLLIQRGADVNYVAKHQITPLHVASKWGKGNMVSLLLDKGANIEAKTRDGLTPLHCAARSGHETVVDMLLEKGAPITAKTKNGLAPLHMASQGDHVDAARILLYHKAPVDDVTVDFLTALHVAAHCGHVRVAKLLLDRKADPNSRALNGFTPLHIACKKNRIKVVELLLKHGASIEATTESGLTPLHVASFMGCMNIVIYLIQHGASADVPTVRGESPLHLAARANQTDIIRILLRNGAEVDAKAREQQTALHIASRLGNTDIVGLLLQQGASVDAPTKDLYTPLHIAAKEGQEEVAGVLLDHGASLNTATKKGFTPLHLAAKYGHLKVARLLLQRDAPVDPKGKNGVTPLHVAAHYDNQNVAMLLLDKGAQPHATAKNGYTPLHIAARKNQMDIAGTLLEYGANANAESKAGFTPLHLSAQEGHTDMATLLLEHGAQPGGAAKNGLTPLHLCAQEDRVPVGAILVKHGAAVDAQTKAGYTPLHVAAHFGQMNMVKFLLQHGTKVDAPTQLGYTPLHQAAQQGHTQIVNLLLENKAQPNMETNDGKTALSIAQRLGYISVVETLKIVTETRVVTNTTTTTEEKYKVVVPETMHETFMSESEDEGADDTMLGDQSYRYLTVDEMKSLGDDSLPIDVTRDEKMDVSFQSNVGSAPGEHISPLHKKELYAQNYPMDNIDVGKAPILAGPESLNTTMNTSFNPPEDDSRIVNDESRTEVPDKGTTQSSHSPSTVTRKATHTEEVTNIWDQFLVSFMVDARGGAMRGCRHSGVRVIIPPRKAAMPMRITCRYLKKDKLVHAPPLMEGEALASRILEMGPSGAKFLGPVIIEVPHFASLRGKEREIVILRSDNGETWREHTLEATEEAVQEVLNESFDGEELKQLEDLNTNRITRVLTTDFPQYFAIVTRIRQEVHAIGPEGGMVSSTVVPQVQAVFPQGALTKKIKVGLQAQPISPDLVAKLLGNRVAVSPILTVEPRRRKFHKPITLTIPVPQAASKGMINQYSGEAPTLRLLCSITGGTTRAQWEDVTGSTPLTFVNDCVSFTTTVSARFWLMDCTNIPEATKMATELYREAIHVPFMAKFVVFSKRHQLEEARVRVFCMTDDKEDKTLESQEHFIEVAKSRDVEVLEGKSQYLEFAGNLIPVTKSGDQLAFNFYAFRENRLPFTVRVKDQNAEPVGRVAFMRQPKVGRGEAPQSPICNLNLSLPENIQPEPAPSEPDLLALEKKYAFLSISKAETIHKADLRLSDISNMLAGDWVALAKELNISDSDINIIKSQYPDNTPQQALVMLRLWMQTAGYKATGNTLEKALRSIHRDDIVNECICNVEVVTDVSEKATAENVLIKDVSQISVEGDIPIKRSPSPEAYEEKDLMKDAESADEEEIAHKIIPDGFTQPSAKLSQMVSGDLAPSDVKPPVSADQSSTEPQPTDKAAGTGPSEAQIKYEQDLNPPDIPNQDDSQKSGVTINGGMNYDNINCYSTIIINEKESSDVAKILENLNSLSSVQAYTEGTSEDVLSFSAHRPTTLKITSSNEFNENETNDSCADTRENELLSEESHSDIKQVANEIEIYALKKYSTAAYESSSKILVDHPLKPPPSSGAIARPERSIRPSRASSTAVLKVKVEKRPITNHSSRERSSQSSKETVHIAFQGLSSAQQSKAQNTTVEDEVLGLMAEVKEVTSEIKKEVRQLRESETPTPETPTPLREFREFICKEEEQEMERLPTITETGREIEEEGSTSGIPGEMDCNLTLKNHVSTVSVSADNEQHSSNQNDKSHTVVPQIKEPNYLFKNAVAKLRRNVHSKAFDPLAISSPFAKRVVNLETPSLNPCSISDRFNKHFYNNIHNTITKTENKSWDISSIVLNNSQLFLNSNRCCSYCNKDFLLNEVCNDLGNIISFVEEGIKISKRIDIQSIIESLDILKYKLGSIFEDPLGNSKNEDSTKVSGISDNEEYEEAPLEENINARSEIGGKYIVSDANIRNFPVMQTMKDVEEEQQKLLLDASNSFDEANGQKYLSDIEEMQSEDEKNSQDSLMGLKKSTDENASEDKLTDSENIEFSDDEIKACEVPIETCKFNNNQQTQNVTEVYARESSPNISCDECKIIEIGIEDIKNTNITDDLENSFEFDDRSQHVTAEENLRDSAMEILRKEQEDHGADTFLPEHYLVEDASVSYHNVKTVPYSKCEFSSKETTLNEKQKLNAPEAEGTTDVGDPTAETSCTYKSLKPKRKKQRQKKRKSFPKSPPNLDITLCEESVTDTEILVNTSDSSCSEVLDDFNENLLIALNEFVAITDTEEMHDSDMEDKDLLMSAIQKSDVSFIPEPYNEKNKIREKSKSVKTDDSQVVTVEENFQRKEWDDEKSFPTYSKAIAEKTLVSDSGEDEEILTGTDDIGLEYKHKISKADTTALLDMEIHSDAVSHLENKKMKSSSKWGLALNVKSDLVKLTDVEECDEKDGSTHCKKQLSKYYGRRADETDSDVAEDSEEERALHRSRFREISKKLRKLPLVSHLSDMKFVETMHGSLSVKVTPDTNKDLKHPIEDNLKGLIFTENNEDDNITDKEYIETSEKTTLNIPLSFEEPQEIHTDTEEFERPDLVFDRPLTPMPPDVVYFSDFKKEKIYFAEDEYGMPHVRIEKDDLVNDLTDESFQEITDPEDYDIQDDELVQFRMKSDDHNDSGILLEAEPIEVSSQYESKKYCEENSSQVENEKILADEETIFRNRRKRKTKSKKSRDAKVENTEHTDTEVLYPDSHLTIPKVNKNQVTSDSEYEHFETSEEEEYDALLVNKILPKDIQEPDVKHVIAYQDQHEGNIVSEIKEENQQSVPIVLVEETLGATDSENGISDVEERTIPCNHSDNTLPENEKSKVSFSVKTFSSLLRNADEAEIKENLLLSEERVTDVESLDDEEETGDQRATSEDSSKRQAPVKSHLMEVDLAVLDSLLTSQEAEVEEMASLHTITEVNAKPQTFKGIHKYDANKVTISEDKPDLPPKLKPKIQKTPPPPPRVYSVVEKETNISYPKVVPTYKDSSEGVECLSSDDGEEQLALMKDSPRWEEEEIEAEDPVDIRPIKAEIKLMVKTTEVGKESIEIRSIREFIDQKEIESDQHDTKEDSNKPSLLIKEKGSSQRSANDPYGSSPKFVRPKEKYSFYDEGIDDFDLMAQVRDIIEETENEKDTSTQKAPQKTEKKKKGQK